MKPETIDDALALLEERPDDVELYQILGGLYLKQQDLLAAWRAYMHALRLDPNDPFTCLYFGTLLSLVPDKKYAMDLYEHAVASAPDLAAAHWCKAGLHRKLGEFDQAEQEYERAVAVAPGDEDAQRKLAEWRVFIAGVRGS